VPLLTEEQLAAGRKIAHQLPRSRQQRYALMWGRYTKTKKRLVALDAGRAIAHKRPRTQAQLEALARGRACNRKFKPKEVCAPDEMLAGPKLQQRWQEEIASAWTSWLR
jgi:hypothetical protein